MVANLAQNTLEIHKDDNIPPLQPAIDRAWKCFAPCWPLHRFTACNPLAGFEHLPIEQALERILGYTELIDNTPALKEINRVTIKWAQVLFDEGFSSIPLPGREKGLFVCWLGAALFDDDLLKERSATYQWFLELPQEPLPAIAACLKRLGVREAQAEELFLRLLMTLPGWSGYALYRAEWSEEKRANEPPVTTLDFLAFRLVIMTLLWPEAKELVQRPLPERSVHSSLTTLQSRESKYQGALLQELLEGWQPELESEEKELAAAQAVLCIDPRSEPLRRALEEQGIETFGYAGFFGLPMAIEQSNAPASPQCPPLLKPKHRVVPIERRKEEGKRRRWLGTFLKESLSSMKSAHSSPFALVEAIGPAIGSWLTLRTWWPKRAAKLREDAKALPGETIAPSPCISLADRSHYAATFLDQIGLTSNFAEWVLICGHGSQCENNPHQAALDCGACGGHKGGPNAQVMSHILNDQEVRAVLRNQGIEIPTGTRFLPAEHNTTLQTLTLLQADEKDPRLLERIDRAEQSLRYYDPVQPVGSMGQTRKVADWAETRPEWGLARNAGMIIGPRSLSKGLDLDGRVFLHSYDWRTDEEGALLKGIMTAPLVVAQWINNQYLFSSLLPELFSAGSKVTHNITGRLGVMQGNGSDFMWGLPKQSLFEASGKRVHEPMRLQAFIEAPRERVSAVIAEEEGLQRLLGNRWISLTCLDPQDSQAYRLQPDLQWQAVAGVAHAS